MLSKKNVDVRFIEFMPFDSNKWNTRKMVPFREMLRIIATRYPIERIERLEDDANDTSKVRYLSRHFLKDVY